MKSSHAWLQFITKHKAINWMIFSIFIYFMDQLLARAPKSPSSCYNKMGLTRVPVLQNVSRFIGKSAVTLVSSKWQNPPWHPCLEFNQVRRDWLKWISPIILIQNAMEVLHFDVEGLLGGNSYIFIHKIIILNNWTWHTITLEAKKPIIHQ